MTSFLPKWLLRALARASIAVADRCRLLADHCMNALWRRELGHRR